MSSLVSFRSVTKSFGQKTVLESVSFDIKLGEVVGVIGLNGCGKTTLFNLLLGSLIPDSGSISYQERTIRPPAMIGALLGIEGFYPEKSAYQNLLITALVKGKGDEDICPLLEKVGLLADKNKPVKGFSAGMKQRLSLANALLGSPKVLVFDEPTVNLDERYVDLFKKMVLEQKALGDVSVIFSSHDMSLVKALASRVLVIHEHHVFYDLSSDQLPLNNSLSDLLALKT